MNLKNEESLVVHFAANKSKQVGGNHYEKHGEYSAWHVLEKWRNPDHMRGGLILSILKYLERYPEKGGVEDLRKARHCIDELIRFECKVAGLPEGE